MTSWTQRVLAVGLVLVVSGLGLWASGAGSSAAGDPVMSIAPASQNVAMNADPFALDVTVSNVDNLGAYDVTVTFNNNVLEYLGIANGDFLTSTGRRQQCIAPYPGPNNTSAAENVNRNGAVHFGCTTLGLDANGGIPGPGGNGVVMSIGFKPKGVGNADIVFRGTKAPEYANPGDATPIAGTGPYKLSVPGNDNGEFGYTGLGDILGNGISPVLQGGVVQVYDPNAPVPTAVPATPTPVAAQPQGDRRATVQALLGTPERRLTDITPLANPNGSGANTDGSGGSDGAGGSESGGGGNGSGGGSGSGGASGGRTGSIAGASGDAGSSGPGGSRGASGAPRAGYGPEPKPANPWPGRVSLALIAGGMGAIVAGAARGRVQPGS